MNRTENRRLQFPHSNGPEIKTKNSKRCLAINGLTCVQFAKLADILAELKACEP